VGGGFKWSHNHISKFETNKFALIDFTCTITKEDKCIPMDLRGTIIKPTPSHKFLGIIIDEHLSWRQHIMYAIGKGTAYTLQLRQLTITSKGLPLSLMRQLFTSIALPKLLYVVDIWFTPIYLTNDNNIHKGSIETAKKTQQSTTNSTTGYDRSTKNHSHRHTGSPHQPTPTRPTVAQISVPMFACFALKSITPNRI
jgi:hypothetical protein